MLNLKDEKNASWMVAAWASLLLLAMHYFQPNAGGAGLYVANNNSSWISISLIAAVGWFTIINRQQLQWNTVLSGFSLVCLTLLLPYLWSDSNYSGTVRLFGILGWWALTVALVQFNKQKLLNLLLWLLILGSTLQALVGLAQFLQPEWFLAIKNHRPVGSFYQPNVLASLLSTSLALCIWQLNQASPKLKIALSANILLHSTVLYLVMSRTGVLAAVAVTMGLLWLLRSASTNKYTLSSITLGVLAALALQSTLTVEGRGQLDKPGYRTTLYSQSFELIAEKPLLGHGIGSFPSVYTEKLADAYQQDPSTPMMTQISTHPHNELLFWGVEAGLLPVMALLAFALWFSVHVWRRGDRFNHAMWLCTIPIILHTQTEYPLYHSVAHLAVLSLLIVAATPTASVRTIGFNNPLQILPKFIVGLSVVLTSALMLTNLHAMTVAHDFIKTQQVQQLQRLVNPFMQPSLLNMLLAEALLKSGDPQAAPVAIELLQDEVEQRPSVGAFVLLANAYATTGQTELMQQTAERGRYLYPTAKSLRPKVAAAADSPLASQAH
ncbi:PglL family O-oligosaccharyltransferase [Ferrimonas senticii]|uniref:PglL family O-oligosaccharyltransferase n=1 Tax=Ferrimonas senticii TaxID=394566 RepID=UPI0003F703BB|nr:Wzy polymerase domain-containing protein [Ferrimonas senticii]